MADYATKSDVQAIVNVAVDDLSQIIQTFASHVDDRFNKVEADVAQLQTDVAELKTDVKSLNNKYDHLVDTLDTFLKRLDNNEVNNATRDAQLARLEKWVEQIASKTGVKLEY